MKRETRETTPTASFSIAAQPSRGITLIRTADHLDFSQENATDVTNDLRLAGRHRRLSRPIPKLRGCVNDIDAFADYLRERVAGDKGVALKLKTLKNAEATRQAVVDAFRGHLGQAKKGDIALFYYSGHGSQEQAPEEFWKIEPDHLDETLVCYDSRNPGSWDLADKEIAKLIGEVAAQGPHCRRDPRLLPLRLGHARDRVGCPTGADRPSPPAH